MCTAPLRRRGGRFKCAARQLRACQKILDSHDPQGLRQVGGCHWWKGTGMARTRRIATFLSALSVMMIGNVPAIRRYCDCFCLNRRGANRCCPQNECNKKNTGCQCLHALRRLRRNGQRINSNTEPARPRTNPPIAKARSHQVLKFSWFFQSMMWRLQKKS